MKHMQYISYEYDMWRVRIPTSAGRISLGTFDSPQEAVAARDAALGVMAKSQDTRPVLVFGDLHAPYQHRLALDFLKHVYASYNCQPTVVCVGDLYDFHSMSRFTSEVDGPGPEEEYRKAKEFVAKLTSAFPKGVLVLGNHDRIPERQMKEIRLATTMLRDYNDLYCLPKGWHVEPLYHVIEGTDILVEHGLGGGGKFGAINMAQAKRCSYVQGHTHASAGVMYHANHVSCIFGMNTGCLVDNTALAMRYSAYSKNKGVLGCGLVWPANGLVAERAEFVPMEADHE